MAWLVFMGWLISQTNKLEDYSNYFEGKGGDFQELDHCPLLDLIWLALNGHGTGGCVIQLMYYNEHIMRLKVYWKLNIPPSWA